MSIDRWVDKDVVHMCSGILLSYKKECNNAISSNMDGPRDYYTKWSKSERESQISYDITYMWNLKKMIRSDQLLSRVLLVATPWIAARQASLPITNSRSSLRLMSSSQWCHPAISSCVVPFSSCPQSLPASGSFPMSQFFASGGQSIGTSASASVLPRNIQDWFPLGWTGEISLQFKGLSRVFSNTTVPKHQFFGTHWNSEPPGKSCIGLGPI